MKKILATVFVCAMTAAFAFAGGQAEGTSESLETMNPMTVRLAHVVNEQDGFHVAAEKFKELVESRTDGKITINIFPNAQLGDERTLLESMQLGTVDMGVITNGPVSGFLPEIAVFELPFLFATPEEAYQILDGPIGQELLRELETVNLKGLAYAERGFRNLTNSVRPVQSPSDMRGLRIRVMENPVYVDTFQALGANTVPMAWTETLTALQQRTIDGQENPINVIYSFRLYEPQQYLSLTRHTYSPALIVMGLGLWNRMPADVQQILTESAQEAAEYERQWNADMAAEQLEALKANGMQVIENPDVAAFQNQIQSVYARYGAEFGEYLDRIQAELR